MRTLIGILSCKRDRFCHQPMRETWLKDCLSDYKFFLGDAQFERLLEDEIKIDAPDEKTSGKVVGMIGYALDHGYDYLFKCDTDTYVHVPRLLASGFEQHNYVGYAGVCKRARDAWGVCYGGSGYWLNKKAMQVVRESPLGIRAAEGEDHLIGFILDRAGIKPYDDQRYRDRRPGPSVDNDFITLHEAGEGADVHNLRNIEYLLEAHKLAQGIQ